MSVLPAGAFGERVARRLRDEQVIWFTSVGADGTPQPNPVWFLWDVADSLLVYNRAEAARLPHVAARPKVSLHFDSNGRGGDIVVLLGTAHVDTAAPAPDRHADYLAKYADAMTQVSGSPEQFAVAYPVALRVTVRRVRGH